MRACVWMAVLLAAVAPTKLLQAQTALKTEGSAAGSIKPAAAPGRLPHQLIYPGDAFYPDALAKAGVQGEVRLEIKLTGDGKASVIKMLSGSKSAELDKNAINFVNTGYYKLPDNGLKYFEGDYSLNIVFIRDSVLTINDKKCADFNTDLAYFRSTRPGESMKNLGVFELVTGIFTIQLMKSQGADGTLKFVKSVDAINGDTVAACAKKPTEPFIKTYVGAAKKRGIKF